MKLSLKIKMGSDGNFAAVSEEPQATVDPEARWEPVADGWGGEDSGDGNWGGDGGVDGDWGGDRGRGPGAGAGTGAQLPAQEPQPTSTPPTMANQEEAMLNALHERLSETAKQQGVARVAPEAASFMRPQPARRATN